MLTENENSLLSLLASDLVTGNYLLGRPRTTEYQAIFDEFVDAAKALEQEQLNARQRDIILGLASMFYGGIDDMAEQISLDKAKLHKVFANIAE